MSDTKCSGRPPAALMAATTLAAARSNWSAIVSPTIAPDVFCAVWPPRCTVRPGAATTACANPTGLASSGGFTMSCGVTLTPHGACREFANLWMVFKLSTDCRPTTHLGLDKSRFGNGTPPAEWWGLPPGGGVAHVGEVAQVGGVGRVGQVGQVVQIGQVGQAGQVGRVAQVAEMRGLARSCGAARSQRLGR